MKNQNGFALMVTLMVLSGAILVSLSLSYLYTVNRVRYHYQIKEAYKLVDASEGAAKSVKAVWDKAAIACPGCAPGVIAASLNPNNGVGLHMPASLSYTNPDNPLLPYQFNTSLVVGSNGNIEIKIKNKIEHRQFNRFENFVAKLDKFFLQRPQEKLKVIPGDFMPSRPTMVGWLMQESQALAACVCATDPLFCGYPNLTMCTLGPNVGAPAAVITNTAVANDCQAAAAGSDILPGCAKCAQKPGVPSGCVQLTMTMNGNTVVQSVRVSNGDDF